MSATAEERKIIASHTALFETNVFNVVSDTPRHFPRGVPKHNKTLIGTTDGYPRRKCAKPPDCHSALLVT